MRSEATTVPLLFNDISIIVNPTPVFQNVQTPFYSPFITLFEMLSVILDTSNKVLSLFHRIYDIIQQWKDNSLDKFWTLERSKVRNKRSHSVTKYDTYLHPRLWPQGILDFFGVVPSLRLRIVHGRTEELFTQNESPKMESLGCNSQTLGFRLFSLR